MFLLIHARIDLNQYYKKMVRLISISDLQYYCEEQEIVYISINRGYEDSYLYFMKNMKYRLYPEILSSTVKSYNRDLESRS